ncbi:MAG: sulfatase [Sedimentisphaerales bacterium]|nr:sulfatase [Sedimentisphaerales bacterium]
MAGINRFSRRSFLKSSALAAAAWPFKKSLGSTAKKQPNIVWLIADDMGWKDCGCYGHPTIKTPNIDRLAAEGIRFTNAFVTSPQCSPMRATLWTGKYAHSMRVEDLHTPLPAEEAILPEILNKNGYYCGNLGKLHLGKAAAAKFDMADIDRHKWKKFLDERPKDKSFFLTVGFTDPHRPYKKGAIESPHTKDDVVVPAYLPDTGETRMELALYYDEISRMDGEIGQILDYLRQHKLEENTIVLFLSDNGSPFPRAKITLYDSGIGTPLIMKWKGHWQPSLRCGLVSTVDIAATFLDILGLQATTGMHGRSIFRQIIDPQKPGRKYVFAERNWHTTDDHIRALRTKKYKYIRNAYPSEPLGQDSGMTNSATFRKMRQLRDAGKLTKEQLQIFRCPRPAEELYDLDTDPCEFRNLVKELAYKKVLAELRCRLDKWVAETNDVPASKRKPDLINRETGEKLSNKKSSK